jgi:two-component system chemotaxis response regulator CheB
MSNIRVMVIDDSAVVRQVVTALLDDAPGIEVMAAVADPVLAIERLKHDWPDVIVLDVEMPRMDGITFLRMVMQQKPTPVVICSTLTERGAKTTLEAMAAGAVAIVTKPKPRERLVARSIMMTVSVTVPNSAKASSRLVSLVSKERFPT